MVRHLPWTVSHVPQEATIPWLVLLLLLRVFCVRLEVTIPIQAAAIVLSVLMAFIALIVDPLHVRHARMDILAVRELLPVRI